MRGSSFTGMRMALRVVALLALLAPAASAGPVLDTLLLTCQGCGAGTSDGDLATIAVTTGALRRFPCPVLRCGRVVDGANQAVWSPRGTRIAVSRLGADIDRPTIWTFPATGGRGRQMSQPPVSTSDGDPVWSPSGRLLAFVRYADSSSDVVTSALLVIDLDSRTTLRVAGWRGVAVGSASFSPDSGRLVFVRTVRPLRDGSTAGSLWIVGRDGRGLRRLTSRADLGHPRWRPDGRIAALDTDGGLVLIDPRTGSETPGPAIGPSGHSAWSPDGRKLAFYRELATGGFDGPFVLDGTAGNLTRLTSSGNPCLVPAAWSPDGRRLAFCTSAPDPSDPYGLDPYDAGTETIWVEGADGTGLRKLWSQYGAEIYSLDWRPR